MVTVSLFRHAKSSWDNPALKDFDRPLSNRGVRAASAMRAFMTHAGVAPDLILCSPARRARETLDIVAPAFDCPPAVVYDQNLYLASADVMRALLRALPSTAGPHAMILAHNPGLQSLTLDLVGAGDTKKMTALAHKFPTAALALISFDTDKWRDIQAAKGRLTLFATPKNILT